MVASQWIEMQLREVGKIAVHLWKMQWLQRLRLSCTGHWFGHLRVSPFSCFKLGLLSLASAGLMVVTSCSTGCGEEPEAPLLARKGDKWMVINRSNMELSVHRGIQLFN